jgi:Xaa-Pro aminopeptidase
MLKLKAESSAFKTMVLSGSRTASAHAQSSSVKIDKSANLLIDLGAKIYGYNSDLTRIYHLSKISKRFKEFCTAVKKAQNEAIAAVKPQVKASKIDNITRKIFAEYGFEKYIIHATGHGIGLFVHEKPYINHKNHLRLKPGMVFTIEPGLYLPGEFGIRLEDVVLVTKSGHKVLSNDIPKSI